MRSDYIHTTNAPADFGNNLVPKGNETTVFTAIYMLSTVRHTPVLVKTKLFLGRVGVWYPPLGSTRSDLLTYSMTFTTHWRIVSAVHLWLDPLIKPLRYLTKLTLTLKGWHHKLRFSPPIESSSCLRHILQRMSLRHRCTIAAHSSLFVYTTWHSMSTPLLQE